MGAGSKARAIKDSTAKAPLTLDAYKTVWAIAVRKAGLSANRADQVWVSVECDRGWNYAEYVAGGVPSRRDQY